MNRATLTELYLSEVAGSGVGTAELVAADAHTELIRRLPPERFLSRPLFLGAAERDQVHGDLENLRSVLVSLPGRLFGGDLASFARAVGCNDLQVSAVLRNAAELMGLSATLQERGIGLELLTGALTGIYDPHGMGAMLFAVLAVGAELDRNYIREKTLEGQQAAAAKGNHGGRPKVIADDMLLFARALRDKGTPMPEITKKLVIKTGKNAGQHPSVASLYRALADTNTA